MQPEGDDLAAVPADVLQRAGLERGCTDSLPERVLPVLDRQGILRPGERRRLVQPPYVVECQIDLDELAAAAPPRTRHREHARDRRLVERAHAIPVDGGPLR